MGESFGVRLAARVAARGALCVGVDPSTGLLDAWGRADTAAGAEFAALQLVEAVAGVATAVKVQVAYFERFAAEGYRVLERVIEEARDADLLVVGDAKRGDIPSTNDGYARAWLAGGPLGVDALTVSPYLGVAALAPFVEMAGTNGRGLFVLAATSNDEGRPVQGARAGLGDAVEEVVLRAVADLNARDDGRGHVGVVWGATRDAPRFDLARLGGPILVPGVGAQGATPTDVARLFARCPAHTVLANVARAVAGAGPERRALTDAARRWRDDLATAFA
ncbi:MAG: orotidine-5'-phosphate decarboxylase [Acidimicrobiales bacterium]